MPDRSWLTVIIVEPAPDIETELPLTVATGLSAIAYDKLPELLVVAERLKSGSLKFFTILESDKWGSSNL